MTKEEFMKKHNLTPSQATMLEGLCPMNYREFEKKLPVSWYKTHNMTRQQLQDIAYGDYGY